MEWSVFGGQRRLHLTTLFHSHWYEQDFSALTITMKNTNSINAEVCLSLAVMFFNEYMT